MRKTVGLALLFALLVAGCAGMRKVDVTSDPDRTYRIRVHNTRSSVVLLEYSDGSVTRQLGQVGGGAREEFVVVASPNNPRITILARTTAGTSLPSQSVNLTTGQTTAVTIY